MHPFHLWTGLRHHLQLAMPLMMLIAILVLQHQAKTAAGEVSSKQEKPMQQVISRELRVDRFGDPLPDEVLTRIGTMRMRHGALILHLAFSPDGKALVTGAIGGIRIWDVSTGKLRRRLNFDTSREWYVVSAFRPDGLIVASERDDKNIATVQLFDLFSGVARRLKVLPRSSQLVPLALSPDGKRFAYVPDKDFLRIYDADTGRETLKIPIRDNRNGHVVFAPDGKTIAFNDSTATIRLHDTISGKKLRELKQDEAFLSRLLFSPDGRFLVSIVFPNKAEQPGQAHVWDLTTGKVRHRLTSVFKSISSASFSPDSKSLALASENGEIVLWNMASGKELRRFMVEGMDMICAFSPDGKTLAASCAGTTRLLDVATGEDLPASADPSLPFITHVRFSADGKRLIGHGPTYYLACDPATGRELHRFAKIVGSHWRLPLSPNETLLAQTDMEGAINLCDSRTGKLIRTLKGHVKYVWYMIFSRDGRKLISSSEDGTIRLWDVPSGRELNQLRVGSSHTIPLVDSPDGRWLASSSDSPGPSGRFEIILWDLTTGRDKRHFLLGGDETTTQMAFSPDSRLMVAGSGGKRLHDPGVVQVWDISTGNLRFSFDAHKGYVFSVAFSTDGRMLATGAADGSLFLWELASGRKRHEFIGHENPVLSLAFSPNNRMLAASGSDVPAYVWNVVGNTGGRRQRLTDDELRRCWTKLAGDDAASAFQSMRVLAAAHESTLPFLREHLKPIPGADFKLVRHLVTQLDSADFPTRQKAADELEKLSDATAGLLRQILLKEQLSLEVSRRVQQILETIESKPESLRAARAVEVLEWIGTPDAVRHIGELANGAPDARLSREASAALQRLRR